MSFRERAMPDAAPHSARRLQLNENIPIPQSLVERLNDRNFAGLSNSAKPARHLMGVPV
jgi:hypothetical protein